MYRGQICNLDIIRTNQSYPPQISRFEMGLPFFFFWVCIVLLGVKYPSSTPKHPNQHGTYEKDQMIKPVSSIFVFRWVCIYLACGSYACRILKGAVQNKGIPNLFYDFQSVSLKLPNKKLYSSQLPPISRRTLLSCKITPITSTCKIWADDFTEIGVK